MNQIVLSNHMWVSLPNEVRWRIRKLFSIPQSSNTVVNDGKVESDGTTTEDFKHLTIEKMQTYLNDTSTDFHKLFDGVVAKVTDELWGNKNESVVVSPTEGVNIVIEPKVEPKKRGRPSKKNA